MPETLYAVCTKDNPFATMVVAESSFIAALYFAEKVHAQNGEKILVMRMGCCKAEKDRYKVVVTPLDAKQPGLERKDYTLENCSEQDW